MFSPAAGEPDGDGIGGRAAKVAPVRDVSMTASVAAIAVAAMAT